jgi:hypothetical protein
MAEGMMTNKSELNCNLTQIQQTVVMGELLMNWAEMEGMWGILCSAELMK